MEFENKERKEEQEKIVVDDLVGLIKIYDDGSVCRAPKEPKLGNKPLDSNKFGVTTRDVVFNRDKGLWARIYSPVIGRKNSPVLIFFHGGGFCMLSPASVIAHNFCVRWSEKLPAVIVSVNYRLAPEHRLPAAYRDCCEAVEWALTSLGTHSDVSLPARGGGEGGGVFLVGETAGANIAHQVMIMLTEEKTTLARSVKGMVLLQPFLGSQLRTPSEEAEEGRSARRLYYVALADTLWRMALPRGSNRDHPFCLPRGSTVRAFPRTLVVVGKREVGFERQREYCRELRRRGVHVEEMVFADEDHAFCSIRLDSPASLLVVDRVRRFLRDDATRARL